MTRYGSDVDVRVSTLREALTNALIWHEAQDKAISKQPNANTGQNGWMRCQHQEQMAEIRKALEDAAKTSPLVWYRSATVEGQHRAPSPFGMYAIGVNERGVHCGIMRDGETVMSAASVDDAKDQCQRDYDQRISTEEGSGKPAE